MRRASKEIYVARTAKEAESSTSKEKGLSTQNNRQPNTAHGIGLGLRACHYPDVLKKTPNIPWFEVISENFFGLGGKPQGQPLRNLLKVRKDYAIALHGVSLSIGSADPLSQDYLTQLKSLCAIVEPSFVSDHLCWSSIEGTYLHDLLPLPYTEEALSHICPRVEQVQSFLQRPVLLENVSSYLTYEHSEMEEWEFVREVSKRTGCGILLDLNNIYVSAHNQGFDPLDYLRAIPKECVEQFHLGGPSEQGPYLIDTHDHPVPTAVWELYELALALFGPIPTLIEWDENIPSFDRLREEANQATQIWESVFG